MTTDFAEVFTVSVRRMVPLLRSKGLGFGFDCTTSPISLPGPEPLARSLHRVLMSVVNLMNAGSFQVRAAVESMGTADECVRIEATGLGQVSDHQAVDRAMLELGLVPQAAYRRHDEQVGWGQCPILGAVVDLRVLHHEGLLLSMTFKLDAAQAETTPAPDAADAGAWVVNADSFLARAWSKRFRRLGWLVSLFDSCGLAVDHLRSRQGPLPGLLIVVEDGMAKPDTAVLLSILRQEQTRLIYAVVAGSCELERAQGPPGFEVRVLPFSPHDMQQFTSSAAAPRVALQPWGGQQVELPPLILIVDDVPSNLLVGRAMVEAQGYGVHTAADGFDAIASCRECAPAAVLMDLQMPGLDGRKACAALRELQREGAIAPFSIIALTAAWSAELRTQCVQEGFDECLSKPIGLQAMGRVLRRFVTLH
ncbi:response regulator [Piscinibacter terrae]|uniref:Response regulator n=1 Tax=Piscinibacter terrae TaxID=2496871 RepID=A0A3N7JNH4_9BURK|nr:response regulator [Albitalea terrae]RQP22699.1 response regulator [Albitalea terrae]